MNIDVAPPKITRIPLHTISLARHVDCPGDRHVAINDSMRSPKNLAKLAYERQISSPGIKKKNKFSSSYTLLPAFTLLT